MSRKRERDGFGWWKQRRDERQGNGVFDHWHVTLLSVCFHVCALCWLENMTADFLFYLCVTPVGALFTDGSESLPSESVSLFSSPAFKSFTPASPYLSRKKTQGSKLLCQPRMTQSHWHLRAYLTIKQITADQIRPRVFATISDVCEVPESETNLCIRFYVKIRTACQPACSAFHSHWFLNVVFFLLPHPLTPFMNFHFIAVEKPFISFTSDIPYI